MAVARREYTGRKDNRSYGGKPGSKPGARPGSFQRNKVKAKPKEVSVQAHPRFPGVSICRGKDETLVTRNILPGSTVYGEKRILAGPDDNKIEYRAWNPFRSKIAAGILAGLENIHIYPGARVLYLGAASGTSVSHVSDIVGTEGVVYAVEFSHRSGRDLLNLAKKRTNIVPIIEDARLPQRYRVLVPMVDAVFADVAQPDQARIIGLNAKYFLKEGGGVVMSIKANCIDSVRAPTEVFANEVNILKTLEIKPKEQVTLEPYERDHAIVVGVFREKK